MTHQQQDNWIDLIADNDYEINDVTHQIRRKKGNMILKETVRPDGYIQVQLKRVSHLKHRLIAQQFIPNPDDLPQVDHINSIRSDNRLDNIRWVSASGNMRNKSIHNRVKYEYVKEIPPESIVVDRYCDWEFEDLYFHDDIFYFYNGVHYRKLYINETKAGYCSVSVIDTSNKKRSISYIKFKRERDLL